jgi:formate hydrogenlyase subunit 6/NADH:ubiquinone oxidoreductase subunit I
MRFGTMLFDVIGSLFRKPATQKYPFERTEVPERLRGKLNWDPTKCTGCSLCVKDCPAQAIEIITIDRATKKFIARYHADRCTYCAQCVHNCRFKCVDMSNEYWELAALNKEPFTVYYGDEANLQLYMQQLNVKESDLPAETAEQPVTAAASGE